MKKVIYTVLTGSYDNLCQPDVFDKNFDYICFSNTIKDNVVGIWKIRPIPKVVNDNQQLSRYPKMHPHVLLPEYDYSLYIDANVIISNPEFYDLVNKKIVERVPLSGNKHNAHNCTYKEFYTAYYWQQCKEIKLMIKEYNFLRRHNFPENWGMYQANVILRNHHDARVIAQCEMWWSLFLQYAKRDQLCYAYTIKESGLSMDYMIEPIIEGQRNFNYFYLKSHLKPVVNKTWYGKVKERINNLYFHRIIPQEIDRGSRLFKMLCKACFWL